LASSNQTTNVCDRGTDQSVTSHGTRVAASTEQHGRRGNEDTTTTVAAGGDTSLQSEPVVSEPTADTFDTSTECEECGGTTFEQSASGQWYCSECGLLQSKPEVEYTEPGWKATDQRRTSPASAPSRLGVGTVIGETEGPTPRWTQYNTRLSNDNATLRHGLTEVRALGAALEASQSLINEAATLFRQAADEGLLVGLSLEAMAAACIHAIARERHQPFPIKAVAAVSLVDHDTIRTAYSKLVRGTDLQIRPPEPAAFVPRLTADAGLDHSVCQRARTIVESLMDDEAHVGQSPTGVAAAAIYGAAKECGVEVTQEELADVAYVSVVTLSRQWQTIKTYTAVHNAEP